MYAYCSNYPWLLVYKHHLTRCRNCLPFQCAFIQKQTYVLGRCCSFAFNFQCNVFICLSSIVSLCLLLTLSLYYRSSFSLGFFLILVYFINERMYIVHQIHSKILQLIGFHTCLMFYSRCFILSPSHYSAYAK